MKKEKINETLDLVCKSVAIAMSVSVIVLNLLGQLQVKDSIVMLAIGLFCISLSLLSKENKKK